MHVVATAGNFRAMLPYCEAIHSRVITAYEEEGRKRNDFISCALN